MNLITLSLPPRTRTLSMFSSLRILNASLRCQWLASKRRACLTDAVCASGTRTRTRRRALRLLVSSTQKASHSSSRARRYSIGAFCGTFGHCFAPFCNHLRISLLTLETLYFIQHFFTWIPRTGGGPILKLSNMENSISLTRTPVGFVSEIRFARLMKFRHYSLWFIAYSYL